MAPPAVRPRALPEGSAPLTHAEPRRVRLLTWELQSFVKELMGSELTVTNLGRWGHEEQHGPLRLRRLHLTVSGLAPLIVGVTTVGGRLSLCSRFLESVIPGARARRLQQGVREQLRAALASHSEA